MRETPKEFINNSNILCFNDSEFIALAMKTERELVARVKNELNLDEKNAADKVGAFKNNCMLLGAKEPNKKLDFKDLSEKRFQKIIKEIKI